MSENNKNGELQCSDDSHTLSVKIELKGKGGNVLNEVDATASIPALLSEENIEIAEARVREQVDIFVNSFKLLFANKVNRLLKSTKDAQIVEEGVMYTETPSEHPEIQINE
tara:strand:+ start:776 stop:1108 length:333 start_codon:yes stop_codon:yes gene_type:complete